MGKAKITMEQRKEIEYRYSKGEKRSTLANEYGVSVSYIYDLTAPNKEERNEKRKAWLKETGKERYLENFKRKTEDVYIIKIKGQGEKEFACINAMREYKNKLESLGISYNVIKKRKQKEKVYYISESDVLKLIEKSKDKEAQEILERILFNA